MKRKSNPVSYDALFHLAELHGLTVYDAAYLDLALREGVPVASLDDALCKTARRAEVPLFKIPQST
jgi:predicted nucleic acid-binding protein